MTLSLLVKGIRGRKRQTALLLAVCVASFAFLTAFLSYSASETQADRETRLALYGGWQAARFDSMPGVGTAYAGRLGEASVGVAVRQGVVLDAEGAVLGGFGWMEPSLLALGRIEPLSGSLPAQPGELALTTTVLDGLGLSYELGQTICLPLAANDYDPAEPAPPRCLSYTLCGVLPAYDVFWCMDGQLSVSALVAEGSAPSLGVPEYQTFFALTGIERLSQLPESLLNAADTMPNFLLNEFGWPEHDSVQFSLFFMLAGVLLITLLAVSQVFGSCLARRRMQLELLDALGAPQSLLRRMCLWEASLLCLAALALGLPLGLLLALVGLAPQGSRAYFTVPLASIVCVVPLFCLAVLGGALLPVLRLRFGSQPAAAGPIRPRKKVRTSPAVPPLQLALFSLLLALSLGCLCAACWQMVDYELNKDNAALNIRAPRSPLPAALLDDLERLPGVVSIVPFYNSGEQYRVTSAEIQSSALLYDVYHNDADPYNAFFFYAEGVLGRQVIALNDAELLEAASWCSQPVEDTEALLRGETALVYWPGFVKINGSYYPATAQQRQEQTLEGPTPGHQLTLWAAGESARVEDAVFSAELTVAGIIAQFPTDALLCNNNPISYGTLLVSQRFLRENAFSYTNINLRLVPDADLTLRRSIASIVTKRGGLLTSDSYEVVNQLYREGSRRAFLLAVCGALLAALGFLLLGMLGASSAEAQRERLRLLLALGASPRRTARVSLMWYLLAGTLATGAVSAAMYALVKRLDSIEFLHSKIAVFTMTLNFVFSYPWALHALLCAVFLLLWLLMAWLPLLRQMQVLPPDTSP